MPGYETHGRWSPRLATEVDPTLFRIRHDDHLPRTGGSPAVLQPCPPRSPPVPGPNLGPNHFKKRPRAMSCCASLARTWRKKATSHDSAPQVEPPAPRRGVAPAR